MMRPYQIEARTRVYAAWESHRSALLVMATGTGKTYTAAEIIRERAKEGRILWLAHRSELLAQATQTLEARIGLGCELEKAESRACVIGGLFGRPVVVASVQTLRGSRLARWPRDAFRTIVVDEAHHAAAKGYRDIIAHFKDAKVLGLTATPDRGDGVGLGSIFDTVAFEYDIRTAIREGHLVDIVQRAVDVADLDISDVKTVAGDLAQGELERRLQLDSVLHQIAAPLVREAGSRPTIVFTAGVAQAHALVDVLAGYTSPERVAAIDGTTPEEIRTQRLDAYRRGEVQFLVNCAVLTEGFDAPETACVAMARPTKSRALYAQCVGRGTRTAPGKTDCLVLDFRGNAGQHRLVTPIDVLAGRPLPPDVEARAKELAEEGKPSEEALAQAEAEAIERERRAEERRRREAKIKADVAYRARTVDPFGYGARAQGARSVDDYLWTLGLDAPSKAPTQAPEAGVFARGFDGPTHGQHKVLIKHGLRTDISRAEAKKAIDAIAAAKWQCPAWVRERYGQRSDYAAE